MTTEKKTEANRENAQKSTGPRTTEGKAAVKLNSLKHGLFSSAVLLADESQEEFDDYYERITQYLSPMGELESLLRIVLSHRHSGSVD